MRFLELKHYSKFNQNQRAKSQTHLDIRREYEDEDRLTTDQKR